MSEVIHATVRHFLFFLRGGVPLITLINTNIPDFDTLNLTKFLKID